MAVTLEDLNTSVVAQTNAMIALTNAYNAKIGTINTSLSNAQATYNNTMTALQTSNDAWQTDFISNFVIANGTTLYVGAGKQFPNIQTAIDFIQDKTIQGNITIQVSDGSYTYDTRTYFNNLPYGGRVSVKGNIANPSACKITYTGPIAAFSFYNVNISFSGFKIVGTQTSSNSSNIGIYLTDNSCVTSNDNSLIIDNFIYGVSVRAQSRFNSNGITISRVWYRGIFCSDGSSTTIDYAIISGITTGIIPPQTNTAPNGTVYEQTVGAFSIGHSHIHVSYATINNINQGVASYYGSYIAGIYNTYSWVERAGHAGMARLANNFSTVTNCTYGFSATLGAQMQCANCEVINSSEQAYAASGGSYLDMSGSRTSVIAGKPLTKFGIVVAAGSYIRAEGCLNLITGCINKTNVPPNVPAGSSTNDNVYIWLT